MMKKILLFGTALFLTACSGQPNLVHTRNPILNITAELRPLIEADVRENSAWVKNKTEAPLALRYDIFWYAENGVTQPVSATQEAYSGSLLLNPQQKYTVPLQKPTAESVNYRLYLRN